MPYGEILKTAFSITRRNRYLWFFGFFAGGGAGFNFGGNFNFGQDGGDEGVGNAIESIEPGVILAIVGVILLLILVVIVLSVISQGALVGSVAAIDRGGERRFATAWKAGTRTFWRVLGLGVLLFLIVLGILLAVGIPLGGIVALVFLATEALAARIVVGVIAGLIAIVALIVLFVSLGIVAQLALRELVVREERIVASLRYGYRLFRARLGPILLVWLIQVGIAIATFVVLFLAALIVGIPLALAVVGLFAAGVNAVAIVVLALAAVVLIPLFLVISGALGTFKHAVWTLAYLRLGRLEPAAA